MVFRFPGRPSDSASPASGGSSWSKRIIGLPGTARSRFDAAADRRGRRAVDRAASRRGSGRPGRLPEDFGPRVRSSADQLLRSRRQSWRTATTAGSGDSCPRTASSARPCWSTGRSATDGSPVVPHRAASVTIDALRPWHRSTSTSRSARRKCLYCDFYSIENIAPMDAFLASLDREIIAVRSSREQGRSSTRCSSAAARRRS